MECPKKNRLTNNGVFQRTQVTPLLVLRGHDHAISGLDDTALNSGPGTLAIKCHLLGWELRDSTRVTTTTTGDDIITVVAHRQLLVIYRLVFKDEATHKAYLSR